MKVKKQKDFIFYFITKKPDNQNQKAYSQYGTLLKSSNLKLNNIENLNCEKINENKYKCSFDAEFQNKEKIIKRNFNIFLYSENDKYKTDESTNLLN